MRSVRVCPLPRGCGGGGGCEKLFYRVLFNLLSISIPNLPPSSSLSLFFLRGLQN